MNNLIGFFSRKFNVDGKYFLNGGFWLLFSQGATITSSLVVTYFLANLLSENEFGIYKYIIGLAALLSVFSLTGISQAILQASSKNYKVFLNSSTRLTFKYSLGIVVISLVGAVFYWQNDNSVLSLGCLLIAIFQPVSQLFQNIISYLNGQSEFRTGAYVNAYKSILVSGSSLICLVFTQNISILLFVFFSTQAASALTLFLLFKPKNTSGEEITPTIYQKYVNYAKHTSFRNILVGISTRLDSIIIFQRLGAVELAIYTIATVLPDQVRGSLKNLQTLILPKFTKHHRVDSMKKIIPKRSVQMLLVLLPITIFIIIIIPFLYTALFPKYLEAIHFAQLLALTFPASIYFLPLSALQIQQDERKLYYYNIFVGVVQILSLAAFVTMFGILGAVISRIITQYSRAIILFYLLFRKNS